MSTFGGPGGQTISGHRSKLFCSKHL